MSETESFNSVMSTLLDGFVHNVLTNQLRGPYDMIAANIDRLQAAHKREIRDTAQQQYSRGYHDGQHSMDAEHRAVAMRLRALPMNRVEYGSNLYDIIEAVCGTNKAGDVDLRDKLIDLMGGVSNDGCTGCGCAAADCDGDCGLQREEVSDGRVADDCGADSRGGDGGGDLHMAGVTDELREWASDRHCKGMSHTDVLNIGFIADRIDAQFDRICAQQEAVLQKTVDEIVDERDELQAKLDSAEDAMNRAAGRWAKADAECRELRDELNKANGENKGLRLSIDEQKESIAQRKKTIGKLTRDNKKVWKTVHELQAKLDEYDSTHVELPRDANGEVFRVDGGARVDDLVLTVRQMTLTKSGWKIRAYDENYEVEREASFFDACAPKPDLIEETIEKLTLGEITQTEAIERIKSFHGTARRE